MLPRSLTIASVALLLLVAPSAQSVDLLKTGPPCAQDCSNLGANEYGCVPGPSGIPVTNLETYKSCFCAISQPAVLAAPSTYCNCTTPAEINQIVNWINSYCDAPAPASSSTALSSSVASISTSTNLPATTPTSTPAVITPTQSSDVPGVTGAHLHRPYRPVNKGSWWHQHGRWIIMVIVLVIGFSIITVAGVYYKRRHDRKQNNTSPTTATASWGPNTTQFRSSSVYEADEAGQPSAVQEKRASFRSMQERRRR